MKSPDLLTYREDIRDSFVILYTEFKCKWRKMLNQPRDFMPLFSMILGFGLVIPVIVGTEIAGAYSRQIANGKFTRTSGAVGSLLIAFGWYVGFKTPVGESQEGAVGPLIQTTTSEVADTIAQYILRISQRLIIVIPMMIVLLTIIGFGSAGAVAVPVLFLGFAPLFVWALASGVIIGETFSYVIKKLGISPLQRAVTRVIFFGSIVVVVAYVVGVSETLRTVQSGTGAQIPGEPIRDYVSVVFIPFGAEPQVLGICVLFGIIVSTPIMLLAAIQIRMKSRSEYDYAGPDYILGKGVPRFFGNGTTPHATWVYLKRAQRNPRKLAHLGPIIILVGGILGGGMRDISFLLRIAPGVALVTGTAVAGVSYCLNPLGDERDQLPLLLSSLYSTRSLLRARMCSGACLGLTISIGIGTPLAVVTYPIVYAVGQTVLAAALAVVSTATALGVGATVPQFERREYMRVSDIHPSSAVVWSFIAASIIIGGIGILLLFLTIAPGPVLPVILGWGIYFAALGAVGLFGYKRAVQRMDSFVIDSIVPN